MELLIKLRNSVLIVGPTTLSINLCWLHYFWNMYILQDFIYHEVPDESVLFAYTKKTSFTGTTGRELSYEGEASNHKYMLHGSLCLVLSLFIRNLKDSVKDAVPAHNDYSIFLTHFSF